jgi:flagellar basal body-associated protein FliL
MNKNTLLVLGIVIKILIVAVGVAFMYRGKPETTTTTVSSTTAPKHQLLREK